MAITFLDSEWKDELPRNLPQQPRTSQSLAVIQGRMQATLTARRGPVFEGEALKHPQASAYSKQSAGESDVAIQADITSDLDGDDISYNLSGSNDDSFASVVDDHENLEVAAKETEVEAEAKMDEATYLLIQRSSRTTSVSSTRHLGAGMLLTPPRSSSKEAEDELSRCDTAGSESPSQATRRGKQKAIMKHERDMATVWTEAGELGEMRRRKETSREGGYSQGGADDKRGEETSHAETDLDAAQQGEVRRRKHV